MKKYAALMLLLPIGMVFAADLPTQHTVEPKDTLWDLANHYYRDPFKWPNIAQANPPPTVKDPHWIYPQQVLQIPALETLPQPKQDVVAPVETQAPAAEVPAAPTEVTLPAPQPEHPENVVAQPVQAPVVAGLSDDGLSDKFPKGMVGSSPSTVRFKAKPGWHADGTIQADQRDGDGLSSQGDSVNVRIDTQIDINPGDQFVVVRMSAPTDADVDQKATYLAYMGLLEIRSRVSDKIYRGSILKSSGAIQAGDSVEKK